MNRNTNDENLKKTKFDCNTKIINKNDEVLAKDRSPYFMSERSEFEKEVNRRFERIEKQIRNVCESQARK